MNFTKIITTKSIRVFLISLGLVFLMAILPHLAVKKPWISPAPKAPDILHQIEPKLKLKENNFQLKKSLISPVSAGSDYEQASAYSVVNFDSGDVLASKKLSDPLPIASLTKIMTAVVGLDLANLDEKFTVSDQAAAEPPTKVMLKSGEQYSFKDLLSFMLVSSANDSAQVIKEGIDNKFGQDIFIDAMNKKAQILGLTHTHFTNAEGLDSPDNYSSVEDLSILSHYAVANYPLITQLVREGSLDLTGNTDLRFYLNNWNGLLGVYPGVQGVKIGNTEKAGSTTIVLSERDGKKVLAVILGAPGVLQRDLWAGELLDLGFNKLAGLPPVSVTEDELRAKYASWKYF